MHSSHTGVNKERSLPSSAAADPGLTLAPALRLYKPRPRLPLQPLRQRAPGRQALLARHGCRPTGAGHDPHLQGGRRERAVQLSMHILPAVLGQGLPPFTHLGLGGCQHPVHIDARQGPI